MPDPFEFLDNPEATPNPEDLVPGTEVETPVTDTETVPETEEAESTEEETTEVDTPPEDKTAQAFAEMRVTLSKQNKFFQTLEQTTGMKPEEFISKLVVDAQTKEAQAKNLPPEAIEEIQRVQAENNALKQKEMENAFIQNVTSFQKDLGLTDEQRDGFIQDAINLGVDIFNPPMELKMVYRAVHFDDLVKAEVKKAVQESITQRKKADDASDPGSSKGKSPGGTEPQEITTIEGLNKLLS